MKNVKRVIKALACTTNPPPYIRGRKGILSTCPSCEVCSCCPPPKCSNVEAIFIATSECSCNVLSIPDTLTMTVTSNGDCCFNGVWELVRDPQTNSVWANNSSNTCPNQAMIIECINSGWSVGITCSAPSDISGFTTDFTCSPLSISWTNLSVSTLEGESCDCCAPNCTGVLVNITISE